MGTGHHQFPVINFYVFDAITKMFGCLNRTKCPPLCLTHYDYNLTKLNQVPQPERRGGLDQAVFRVIFFQIMRNNMKQKIKKDLKTIKNLRA